jgi:hypothetical protein
VLRKPETFKNLAAGKHSARSSAGASLCNRCICESCTGFGCPWVPKPWRYWTRGNLLRSERCQICIQRNFKMLYDCDFYTNHRRKRFFVRRSHVIKETKLDKLIEQVSKIEKTLDSRNIK